MGTARPNFFGFFQSGELGIEVQAGRLDPRMSEIHASVYQKPFKVLIGDFDAANAL